MKAHSKMADHLTRKEGDTISKKPENDGLRYMQNGKRREISDRGQTKNAIFGPDFLPLDYEQNQI